MKYTMTSTILSNLRTPRVKLAGRILAIVFVVGVTVLAGKWFAKTGFPLADADPRLLAATVGLFAAAFACKAWGWQRLFAPHERPGSVALAAAAGAASLTGIALPGRFDDAVRVAVVRKTPGCPAGVRAVALSLFTLGLVDTVALMPLASTAAATSDTNLLRIGLGIVAFAGIGAGGVILALPRINASARFVRFRLCRWLGEHWPTAREASAATIWVLGSWVLRGLALYLLLVALGFEVSLPLAMIFMTAAAASAAIPIGPAGAVTQAGAGSAVLIASGMSVTQAVTFAVAAQLLAVLVGAAVLACAIAWHGGLRLAAARARTV